MGTLTRPGENRPLAHPHSRVYKALKGPGPRCVCSACREPPGRTGLGGLPPAWGRVLSPGGLCGHLLGALTAAGRAAALHPPCSWREALRPSLSAGLMSPALGTLQSQHPPWAMGLTHKPSLAQQTVARKARWGRPPAWAAPGVCEPQPPGPTLTQLTWETEAWGPVTPQSQTAQGALRSRPARHPRGKGGGAPRHKPGPQGCTFPHGGRGRRGNWRSKDRLRWRGGGRREGAGLRGTARGEGPGNLAGHRDLQRRPHWTPLSPGRSLGWALPLGTATQASLPPYRQHGGPCEIRAHGASLASRPGDKRGLFSV